MGRIGLQYAVWRGMSMHPGPNLGENTSMALPRKPMVQFLIEKGFLTQEQYAEAQKVQAQTG